MNGSCSFTCKPGYADCNKQGPNTDGCETDLVGITNCGGCGIACPGVPNGVAACVNGKCGIGACGASFGDCDGTPQNGCETRTETSVAHCGACQMPCPMVAQGAPACVLGKCVVGSCNGSFRDCDGNLQNGCETDTTSSVQNCGGCKMACSAIANGTAGCAASKCRIAACNGAFRDCDMNLGNGCEVDTATDIRPMVRRLAARCNIRSGRKVVDQPSCPYGPGQLSQGRPPICHETSVLFSHQAA